MRRYINIKENYSCKGCKHLKFSIISGRYCNKDGVFEIHKGNPHKVICPLENSNIATKP